MEVTNRISYTIANSAARMDEILNSGNGNYADKTFIPSRSLLTYTNGFYVNVTALFIDIVGSSDMTDSSKRPTLAKIYRGFISECTAVLNSQNECKEININGDCVWGVFETPNKSDIDSVFSVAAKLYSMVKVFNYKLRKKCYQEISVGIGIDYGRALMVKAGYAGSSLSDVIWMGDVVNSACHIANKAGRSGKSLLIVSSDLYAKLSEHNQNLLSAILVDYTVCYGGCVVNTGMDTWYKENCK